MDFIMAYSILLVDDEPGIRETLPSILALHGFEVSCKATVAEALGEIAVRRFDVLISDLNIGQPGDGFTVVSAMRRTQPECLTFILTGYPAFETALQAIRGQVDDYLTKPTRIPDLVQAIAQKLQSREYRAAMLTTGKRISEVLGDNVHRIVERTLAAMKAESELATVHLSDEQMIFPVAPVLRELAGMLASPDPERIVRSTMRSAAMRGQIQRLQGYSIPLVVASLRLLQSTVYDVIDENLLALDISHVIGDIRRMHNSIALQLQETVRAYLDTHERQLAFERSEHWAGWFCARCCWNRHADGFVEGDSVVASRIKAEFEEHDCEASARESWDQLFHPLP